MFVSTRARLAADEPMPWVTPSIRSERIAQVPKASVEDHPDTG